MKDFFTAALTTAKNLGGGSDGCTPRILVEIDLPSGTVYLAEHDLTFNGQAYEGILLKIGDFNQTSERGMDSVVLEIVNLKTTSFSSVLEATIPEKAPVRIYQHFLDISPDDPANLLLLFDGVVDRQGIRYTETQVTLPCIDRTIEMPDTVGIMVTGDNLPDAAEDAMGKVLPIVYGDVERVPAIPASVLPVTKLYGSLPASDTSAIEVEDTADFAASGQIDIDEERITYTSLTATTFVNVTRGASSTVAADHSHGSDVRQVGTERYIVAGHPVKVLTTAGIKVGPKLQTPVNLTSVSASDAASFPVVGTVATATFDGKPTYKDVRPSPEKQDVATTAAGGSNSASDPTFACGEHAAYEESNFATLAPGQTLHVTRSGAVSEAGDILKAWAVVRWFGERGVESAPLTGLRGPLNVSFKPAGGAFTALGALDLPKAQDAKGTTDGATGRNIDDIDHAHGSGGGVVTREPMTRASENEWEGVFQSGRAWGNELHAMDGIAGTYAFSLGIPIGINYPILEFKHDNVKPVGESTGATLVKMRVGARVEVIGGGANTSLQVNVAAAIGFGKTVFVPRNTKEEVVSPWFYTSDWGFFGGGIGGGSGGIGGGVGGGAWAFFRTSGQSAEYRVYEAWIDYETLSANSALTGTKLKKPSNPIVQYLDITSLIQTAGIGDWSKLNGCEIKIAHAGTVGGGNPDFNALVYEVDVVVEHFPYTLVETEDVFADLEGYADDGSGTYTGTPDALIENPADVVRHFGMVEGGLVTTDFDRVPHSPYGTPSFGHARTQYASAGYKFAGAIVGSPPTFDSVLKQMAVEARAWIFWEGTTVTAGGLLRMRYQASSAPAADKSVVIAAIRNVPILDRMSLSGDFANLLTILYDKDRSKSSEWKSRVTDEVAASRSNYGDYPRTFQSEWINDATTAANLMAFMLVRFGTPKRWGEFSGLMDQLELERGDTPALTYALLGLSSSKFLIESVRRGVGVGKSAEMDMIHFRAREW